MTELYFAVANEPEPLYAGMPLPLLLGIIGGLITLAGALIAAFSKKWRTPADDREDKKVGIEVNEQLLEQFNKLLEERDKRIDRLVAEVKEVRVIAENAVSENRILIDWIYAAVQVARALGFVEKLPNPPKGVHIADHPSARLNTGGSP
ncbi:hypothetical protein DM793_18825 [Paenarthrobacter nitroguajacolicus]|uniref:hypothetical protein n=1 Tax=Paenarthrobacter nitroguajacolicus TaxID=211146 RepID=UPI0015BFB629|nr:hypothetical protein [Paenarthrobacter nitroguajacolicus]NWL13323.1 hypothetical protein [Paenarthrobacter nitroguajacolicus]